MEEMQVIYVGFYDKKLHKFMLNSTSKISFEDLYQQSNEKVKDEKNNELINEKNIKNIKYLYNNPHKIQFIFPDGETQEIYIANIRQFLHIDKEITNEKDLKIQISKDGIKYDNGDDINKIYSSEYIKYTISSIDENDYRIASSYIKTNDPLSLNDLSLNYDYFLDNTNFVVDKKNFFINTEQRKEFFQFLDNKLLDHKYLALCGLEGIGKTASVLAYLKYSTQTYFYFNVKAIDKLLVNKEISEIRKILLREMFHFIEFDEAKKYYDFINEILEKNHIAFDIFKRIFEKIKDYVQIIVVDQYKTKYDPNYYVLQSILNSKYKSNIIIISSMNEDDIRKSIIVSIKWALKISDEKPILNYYYIIDLVKVGKDRINLLTENEKKLLNEFGNLYIYYYKIKKAINCNATSDLSSFKKDIKMEMDGKIREFFYNSQSSELLETFISLIMEDEKEIELKDSIKIIDKIPLRYFIFKHKEKNIIHFTELKSTDKISFNSAFIYIREYFLYYYNEIVVNKTNNDLNKSTIKNQDSINLEKYFGYFLWAFRNVIKLNNTNIVNYQIVNSLIDMKDECIESLASKIKKLEDGKSILLLQKDQNAKMFDIGILEKKNGIFNLYLIQVTIKKDSDERITVTGLNDNANFLNGFFNSKIKIKFKNNYFCYIFSFNDPDYTTIEYCKRNNLDYFLFDFQKLILHGKLVLKPLKYYLPAFKYIYQFNIERMINIEKVQFSECKNKLDDEVRETKAFLNKKRELLGKKDLKIKEFEKLKAYESLIKGSKTAPMNYERKEFIINNYLLSNEFKDKKIYGISYKKRNRNDIFFTDIEKKNLFELCEKKMEEYEIFQVDKLKLLHFNQLKPEFGCYIIFQTLDGKKYFFNFINNSYYSLDDKNEDNFYGKKLVTQGNFYSILFLNKNIKI